MSGVVAYFAYIVDRHHHLIVGDKLLERLTVYQTEKTVSVGDGNILHKVQGFHDILQSFSGVDGREVWITHLILFCGGTEAV